MEEAVKALLEYREKVLKTLDDNAVRQTKNYPLSFVLCCLADKNVEAKIAWDIHNYIKDYSFEELTKFTVKDWQDILNKVNYTRYKKVSNEIISAINLIKDKYNGQADKIWTEANSFSEIIVRFLEFKGIGIKIATMAANLLNREFGIGNNFKDKNFMDISPDTHVKQIFYCLGFVSKENKNNKDIIIYTARSLNPEEPYLLDLPCYTIGKEFCKKRGNKKCNGCPVNKYCKMKNLN